MDMTNWNHMGLQYMDALMGKFLWWNVYDYGNQVKYFLCSFSRRIMWMKAGRTNNDASVVAQYYLDCVETIGGNIKYYMKFN